MRFYFFSIVLSVIFSFNAIGQVSVSKGEFFGTSYRSDVSLLKFEDGFFVLSNSVNFLVELNESMDFVSRYKNVIPKDKNIIAVLSRNNNNVVLLQDKKQEHLLQLYKFDNENRMLGEEIERFTIEGYESETKFFLRYIYNTSADIHYLHAIPYGSSDSSSPKEQYLILSDDFRRVTAIYPDEGEDVNPLENEPEEYDYFESQVLSNDMYYYLFSKNSEGTINGLNLSTIGMKSVLFQYQDGSRKVLWQHYEDYSSISGNFSSMPTPVLDRNGNVELIKLNYDVPNRKVSLRITDIEGNAENIIELEDLGEEPFEFKKIGIALTANRYDSTLNTYTYTFAIHYRHSDQVEILQGGKSHDTEGILTVKVRDGKFFKAHHFNLGYVRAKNNFYDENYLFFEDKILVDRTLDCIYSDELYHLLPEDTFDKYLKISNTTDPFIQHYYIDGEIYSMYADPGVQFIKWNFGKE